MQRVTQGLGGGFILLEEALWQEFLPDLFHAAAELMPDWKIT